MEIKNVSGIYLIKSIINNNGYIGSAVNLKRRKNEHLNKMRKGIHTNTHLQNHFNKHGNVLEFSVLEYCDKDKLIEREQYYIDSMNPTFNVYKKAYSPLGCKHTEEFKKRVSETFKGKKQSEELIRKRIESRRGYRHSDETKKKIRDAWVTRRKTPISEETKKKMSKAQKGRKVGEEGRKRMREAWVIRKKNKS